jgi:hypothetical protein
MQDGTQEPRLGNPSRITVENKSSLAISPPDSFHDRLVHDFISDKRTRSHLCCDPLAQIGLACRYFAEGIARGNIWNFQPLAKQTRLRSFACSRATSKNEYVAHHFIVQAVGRLSSSRMQAGLVSMR